MINPSLFARLMRLPDHARADLLEFVGSIPVADTQLSALLDEFDLRFGIVPPARSAKRH